MRVHDSALLLIASMFLFSGGHWITGSILLLFALAEGTLGDPD